VGPGLALAQLRGPSLRLFAGPLPVHSSKHALLGARPWSLLPAATAPLTHPTLATLSTPSPQYESGGLFFPFLADRILVSAAVMVAFTGAQPAGRWWE
jgi:hypothetical protein